MPYESRWTVDIPTCSLPEFLFGSPTGKLEDKPLIIQGDKPEYSLSLKTYRDWSKRLASGLKKAGFQAGDRLLLFSGNTIFYSVCQFGTIMAGGIFSGANPNYVPREIAHQLRDTGAKFFFVGQDNLETGLKAAAECSLPRENVFVFDDGIKAFEGKATSVQGVQSWTTLLASPQEGEAFRYESFTTREQQDRTAVLNYSSGTTGLPKGVEITHRNYIANSVQTNHVASLKDDFDSWRQRARGIAFLPMYHAYGQTYYGVNFPRMGVPMYVMRKYDFLTMLQWIAKYRITDLTLVPPIVVQLTKRSEVTNYDLSSLEGVGCGAAPLSKESVQEFERKYNAKISLKQGWGMTEVTCSAVSWDPERETDPTAVGELLPNVEAMIVDEQGNEVQDGESGELWVRAPNVMKCYRNRPEETTNTLTADGWLKTGDVAFMDRNLLLHIVDRKKELIKVKGLQVAPAELEGILLDHPEVDDAAVVGVTINGEEAPRAYIVLKAGAKATTRDVAAWMAERVSRHKRLEGGVVAVDAIPKNPSGKLLRKELRDRAKKEVGDGRQSKL